MAAWAKRSGFGSRGAQGLLPQQTPRVPPSPTLTSSAAANEISLSPSTPAKASTVIHLREKTYWRKQWTTFQRDWTSYTVPWLCDHFETEEFKNCVNIRLYKECTLVIRRDGHQKMPGINMKKCCRSEMNI
ncbi:uncharacterized protein [Triticum aestivum]|uniref:uncharacterized protein n=1 Tax=Triticum aestivum TaxID=4565 RepID=UPI001D00A9CD|nr:uncharacterized protein LOC123072413 [Triticum aestivum]